MGARSVQTGQLCRSVAEGSPPAAATSSGQGAAVPEYEEDSGFVTFLNVADLDELTYVKHLGARSAQRIIAYRQAHGHLRSVNDLVTQVGLNAGLVRQVLGEQGLPLALCRG